ncbi:MAG: transposase [Victivallales bacterium]|nr:transposase [Victivallales bacterium]
MSRKPRNLLSESYYHVTQKCNYDAFLFKDTSTCARYLELMAEVFVKYGLPVLAYCLMGNHIHLLTRTGEKQENLSCAMRELSGRIAAEYNKTNGKRGHFWAERFHSILVAGLHHLRNVIAYIDANPLNTEEMCDPIRWTYCSFHEFQALKSDISLVDRKALLDAIQLKTHEEFLEWQRKMMDLQRGVKYTGAAAANTRYAGHYALGVREALETLQRRLVKRHQFTYLTCLETETQDAPALWALDLCSQHYASRKIWKQHIRHHLRLRHP